MKFMEGVQDPETKKVDIDKLAQKLKPQPIQERLHYSRGIGATLSGRKPIYNQIKNQNLQRQMTEKYNEDYGFNTLKYAIKEDKGPLMVKILNKKRTVGKIGIRTTEGTATEGLDYEKINKILHFKEGQEFQSISIGIVDDDIVEPDENFFVELFDLDTNKRLVGKDTKTEVIIIDNDNPGVLTFKERLVKASENQDFAEIILQRVEGSDGLVGCRYYSKEKDDELDKAIAGEDFHPVDEILWFEHNEIIKTIKVPILHKGNDPERDDTFEIRIEKLSGEKEQELFKRGGTHPKFSKKNYCLVEITASLDFLESVEKVRKILEVEDSSWPAQFKQACMLAPSLTDDGIEEVTCLDALMHFLTIFWKLLFALIPPRKMCGGWGCFIVSLIFIGLLTAVVAEAATIFGCVINLKPAVTAISFVALGTSLPDTFASRQAALESKTADAAIGNVTGSNSVNVFLGLGLPWLYATIYKLVQKNEPYSYPAGKLSFSVVLYLATSVTCFAVLLLRRYISGGELGGMNGTTKWLTGAFCVILWLIYLIMSSLQVYGVIKVFE
jgi:solute carrier family 8 (sodium/calcium exchanger)